MEVGLYTQTFGVGRNPYLQAQAAANQTTQNAQNQPNLASAVAAQRTAPVQQTQTPQAAQATGRSENSREARTNTDTGAASDTTANSLDAETAHLAVQPRGSKVDVYV
ncbi:MAG: hypothetical protein HY059_20335 [Proteobacteria bacterium]|nr:hypothetical protein [Pseudomonadota bacterium]